MAILCTAWYSFCLMNNYSSPMVHLTCLSNAMGSALKRKRRANRITENTNGTPPETKTRKHHRSTTKTTAKGVQTPTITWKWILWFWVAQEPRNGANESCENHKKQMLRAFSFQLKNYDFPCAVFSRFLNFPEVPDLQNRAHMEPRGANMEPKWGQTGSKRWWTPKKQRNKKEGGVS